MYRVLWAKFSSFFLRNELHVYLSVYQVAQYVQTMLSPKMTCHMLFSASVHDHGVM